MAYLNQQERTELLEKLKKMKFNRAKGKLRRMDPKGQIAYFRNAQEAGKLVTCFNLEGLGTRVFLVEKLTRTPTAGRALKPNYEFVEVIVEPTPENRT
jgi:hypothetical protein